jgi:hypothetical protein
MSYILYLVRAVVQRIKEGMTFALENAINLRRMGYMVLLIGVLGPFMQFVAANEILRMLPEMAPAVQPGASFEIGVIFGALFILLLAQIWSYGIELERDRALTI